MIRTVGIIALALMLAGCASNRAGDFCLVSSPIRGSSQDSVTDGTKSQIVAHNRYGATVCGWRP